MQDVVIIDGVRTAIGRHAGALSDTRPDDLAALVIREIVNRTGIDPAEVEEVFFGCANQAGEDNRNVARMAALLAGLPHAVGGVTVNRLCASGLNAVNQAARAIAAGEGDVYIAGGVESMTRAPYSLPKNSRPFGPSGNVTAWDTTLGWRYPNPKMEALFPLEAMGETAENIYQMSCDGGISGGVISREEQDAFALESQRKALAAINDGRFQAEIVPVLFPQRKGDPIVFDTDEHPRIKKGDGGYVLDTSMETLAKLKPAFPGGTYSYSDGTSMAGPHVAGVVALLWSANPALIGDVDTTERILTGTAQPIIAPPSACDATADLPNNTTGYGLVDAYAAVAAALSR